MYRLQKKLILAFLFGLIPVTVLPSWNNSNTQKLNNKPTRQIFKVLVSPVPSEDPCWDNFVLDSSFKEKYEESRSRYALLQAILKHPNGYKEYHHQLDVLENMSSNDMKAILLSLVSDKNIVVQDYNQLKQPYEDLIKNYNEKKKKCIEDLDTIFLGIYNRMFESNNPRVSKNEKFNFANTNMCRYEYMNQRGQQKKLLNNMDIRGIMEMYPDVFPDVLNINNGSNEIISCEETKNNNVISISNQKIQNNLNYNNNNYIENNNNNDYLQNLDEILYDDSTPEEKKDFDRLCQLSQDFTKKQASERLAIIHSFLSDEELFNQLYNQKIFDNHLEQIVCTENAAYEYQKKQVDTCSEGITNVFLSINNFNKLLDFPNALDHDLQINNSDQAHRDVKLSIISILDKIADNDSLTPQENGYLVKLSNIYQQVFKESHNKESNDNVGCLENKNNRFSYCASVVESSCNLKQLIHKEAVENDHLRNLREQKETLKNQVIQTAQEVISQIKQAKESIKDDTDSKIEKVAQSITTYQRLAGLGTKYFVQRPEIIDKYNAYKGNVNLVKIILEKYTDNEQVKDTDDKDLHIRNLYSTYHIVGSNNVFSQRLSNQQKCLQLSRSVIEGQEQNKKILEELLKEEKKAKFQALTTAAVVTGVLAATATAVYYTQPKK